MVEHRADNADIQVRFLVELPIQLIKVQRSSTRISAVDCIVIGRMSRLACLFVWRYAVQIIPRPIADSMITSPMNKLLS